MNWYVAKVIFRIISNDGVNQAQFDEQLRLICAESKAQAYDKAVALGKQNEDRFTNDQKQAVKWAFVNVAEINELNGLEDGVELYCNIHEAADPELYIGWANHRAALIELDK